MIALLMMLPGCWRLRCEPSGRVLWNYAIPRHLSEVPGVVDGFMAGLSCELIAQ